MTPVMCENDTMLERESVIIIPVRTSTAVEALLV